ncbi:MAG: GspH/FimT family pseudopilin [Gammaproteobacteria bacterium]|nr:GspH/FimT family pseudopilin [Gammaproteobacteria bacterium]
MKRNKPSFPALRRRMSAFTLTETLVVLAIVAIIVMIATPSLQNLLLDNRMATRVNDFMTHLHLARSEAIHRHQRVVLCPSADQASCAPGSHWHAGWIIFVDSNANRTHESGEEILRLETAQYQGFKITSGNHQPVVFQPEGGAGGTNDTFIFCDTRGAAKARAIVLSNTGRARIADKKPGGKALVCV